ncbi:MAG: transglutaminase-like domain-containing protein [Candidatus Omnitrophota bacterium]
MYIAAFFSMALGFIALTAEGDISLPESAADLLAEGEYSQAARIIDAQAAQASDVRERLAWEAERLRRIVLDYSLDREELLRQLRRRIKDFQENELAQWMEESRFDWRKIDGEMRFLYPSVSNLFFRYPELRARRRLPASEEYGRFLARIAASWRHPEAEAYEFVRARRFHVQMNLTIAKDAAPDGANIRCWLPIPIENSFQKHFSLISSDPAALHIAASDAPHRSIYLEKKTQAGKPTAFTIDYEYVSSPRYGEIDSQKVTALVPAKARRFTLEEPPHIVFLPEMGALLESIAGEETNPYTIAKRIYDWIGENFRYSYAPEYSTIRNLSHYALAKRYGDCGQIAMLFITLCRMKGIPARWESGWMLYPEMTGLHDWCAIYLDPYGWIPVDANMGISALHDWDFLSPEEKETVRDFYFGRMDPYRLEANSNHGGTFDPAKKYFRSDPVDFQRGEAETSEENLYYHRFDYDLKILSSQLE